MKILLYSQHVLGVGHFFRSMQIAKALSDHEVLFVEGGDPIEGFIPPQHVRRLMLPSIMMDSEFKSLNVNSGNVDETKNLRKQMLADSFRDFAPDVMITELFPFGRKQFRFELLPILQDIRSSGLRTKVICSLRDILVEKKDQLSYERGVLELLNTYYDLLLIHSDPALIRLDETFDRLADIKIPIHYTGFVVREAPQRNAIPHERVIVASSGGGKVGVDLLSSTIEAVQLLPDKSLQLRVFLGPFMEKADVEFLTELASRDSRIALRPFSLDFLAELAAADLSISMAGYNTCMDILSTGVKALVYPFPQNREQALRARKLEQCGILHVLDGIEQDSGAKRLSERITHMLERPMISMENTINLSGARTTAVCIEKHFVQS